MNVHADKTEETKSKAVANALSKEPGTEKSAPRFVDNRPEAIAQRKLQAVAHNSPQVMQLRAVQEMADTSWRAAQTTQLKSVITSRSAPPVQKKSREEEELLQQKIQETDAPLADAVLNQPTHRQPVQKKKNNTGLPDVLKTGIESLSGMSLDDVKVHYNSDKPAQLQAHAYAQGTDIHVSPGQEKHLGHEAWHVVQQKQGRVQPTVQLKGKVQVNDDAGLEREADEMGMKAWQQHSNATTHSDTSPGKQLHTRDQPVQAKWISITPLQLTGDVDPKARKAYWLPDEREESAPELTTPHGSVPDAPPPPGATALEEKKTDAPRKKGWWKGKVNDENVFTPQEPLKDMVNSDKTEREEKAKGIPGWVGSKAEKVWDRDLLKDKSGDQKEALREAYMRSEPLVSTDVKESADMKSLNRENSIKRALKSNREDLAKRLLLSDKNMEDAARLIKGTLKGKAEAKSDVPIGTRQTAPGHGEDPEAPGRTTIDEGSKLNYQNAKPGQTLTGVLRLTDLKGGPATMYLYPNQAVEGYEPMGYQKFKPVKQVSAESKEEKKPNRDVPSIGNMTIVEFIAKLKTLKFEDEAENWEKSPMGQAKKGFAIEHTAGGTQASHAQLTELIDQLEQVANRTEHAKWEENYDDDDIDAPKIREELKDNKLQDKKRIVGFTIIKGGVHTSNKYLFTSAGSNTKLFQGKDELGQSTLSVNRRYEMVIKQTIENYDAALETAREERIKNARAPVRDAEEEKKEELPPTA